MRFVALIPARGGSKRIPRKNLEKVGGLTLVERAIRCAKEASVIDAVYVSTDDAEITQIALHAGARVIHRIHDDVETPMEEVVRGFLNTQLVDGHGDVVILLEPTAPLRTPEDINVIVHIMRTTDAPAARIVSVDTTGKCHGWVYRDVGLASAIRVSAFTDCLFSPGTVLLHGGDGRAIDVDTPEDLERARALA